MSKPQNETYPKETKEVNDYEQIVTHLDKVFLHAEVMIDGKTEKSIDKQHIPTITEMGWNKYGQIFVRARNAVHWVPSAAVKQAVKYS